MAKTRSVSDRSLSQCAVQAIQWAERVFSFGRSPEC